MRRLDVFRWQASSYKKPRPVRFCRSRLAGDEALKSCIDLEGFVVSYKANANFSGKRAMLVFFSEPRYSHSPSSRALVMGE